MQLQRLALHACLAKSGPSSITRMKGLTHLSISSTCLKSLPRRLGQLPRLAELHVSSSGLHSLPPGPYASLTSLHLDYNSSLEPG